MVAMLNVFKLYKFSVIEEEVRTQHQMLTYSAPHAYLRQHHPTPLAESSHLHTLLSFREDRLHEIVNPAFGLLVLA
jgi:hypothetical protein